MRGLFLVPAAVALLLLVVPAVQAAPPTVNITAPDDGAVVAGNVTVNGTAEDQEAYGTVENVSVRIDNGTWMPANDTSGTLENAWSTWTLTWNSSTVADGNHTITARATDNDGETATDTINVTVDNRNETTPPANETPPADLNLTLEARQSGCSGNRTWCFVVTDGNLSALDPGTRVNLTLVNPAGNLGHSLYAGDHADADPDHQDTPAEAAFASIPTTPGGSSASTVFTVPSGVDRVYLWCDESQHEGQGMYLHEPAEGPGDGNQTDGNGTDGGDGTDGGTDGGGNGIPGPSAGLAGVAAAAAALARRRRRR